MNHIYRILIGALGVLAIFALSGPISLAEDGIIYVDAGAAGANNGSSWADAYTDLQPALDAAIAGDQIWVAAGTYKPTVEHGGVGDRYKSFQMKNGVAIYGGFNGSESSLDQRDWVNNVTILSADLNGDDGPNFANNLENSYHVFYHPEGTNLDSSAILDGFTISGANSNAYSVYWTFTIGGGMFNYASSPSVRNCTFLNSYANVGGGMFNGYASSPVLVNCTFLGNRGSSHGGGIYNYMSSSPTIENCTFDSNTSSLQGGGMFNYQSASPVLTNCIFTGNSSGDGGGMYNSVDSIPTLTNCTFSGNTAVSGGGIYNYYTSSLLSNSILWGDTPDEIYNFDANSTAVVTYSDVQGGYAGEGNLNADPLFLDATNGDFHLAPESPCMEVGNNAAVNLPAYDFEGDARILDGNNDGIGIVDMGVDEVRYLPPVEVEIDIKPTSSANTINLASRSSVPVAILTTAVFDASTVDIDTVLFAGAGVVRSALQDVDGDGDVDLLLYFKIQELDLDDNSTEATLTGETLDGAYFEDSDRVKII